MKITLFAFIIIFCFSELNAVIVNSKTIVKSVLIIGDNNKVILQDKKSQVDLLGKVELEIRMAGHDDPDVEKLLGYSYYPAIHYSLKDLGHILEVLPDDENIKSFIKNNKINVTEVPDSEIDEDEPLYDGLYPPTFDIRVINNSKKTVTINEIVMQVKKSQSDKKPFISVFGDPLNIGKLFFQNEGDIPISGIELEYSFFPREKEYLAKKKSAFIYKAMIGKFKSRASLDLKESLKMSGVDVNYLMEHYGSIPDLYRLEKALGDFVYTEYNENDTMDLPVHQYTINEMINKQWPYIDFYTYIAGKYKVMSEKYGIKYERQGQFGGYIPLTDFNNGYGGGLTAYNASQAYIPSDCENYLVKIPVSSYLKPLEVDKFLFRILTDKTSEHEFSIIIELNDNKKIKSKPIYLYYFLPRNIKERWDQEKDI